MADISDKSDSPGDASLSADPDDQILDIYARLYAADKPNENALRTGALNDIRAEKVRNPVALGEFLRQKIGEEQPYKKHVPSWLFSALIACDPESEGTRQLLLRNVKPSADRWIRFWILAGAYSAKLSYTQKLAAEVAKIKTDWADSALAKLIISRDDSGVIKSLKERLAGRNYDSVIWVLRVIRIIPVLALVPQVCGLLQQSIENQPLAYDVFHALCSPPMASAAAAILQKNPGSDIVVRIFMENFVDVNTGKHNDFALMLSGFFGRDNTIKAIGTYVKDNQYRMLAKRLMQGLGVEQLQVPGYSSDSIDVNNDYLGIEKEVKIMTAIILSRKVSPPLAIGLFGDWGMGKSFFMESMYDSIKKQVDDARPQPQLGLERDIWTKIVQVRFNAWHYVDSNLWASLVSNILERLAKYVYGDQDEKKIKENKYARLMQFLEDEQAEMKEARAKLGEAQEACESKRKDLNNHRTNRECKEKELTKLRLSDIYQLANIPEECSTEFNKLSEELGLSSAITSMSELRSSVIEANQMRGKVAAIFSNMTKINGLVLFLLAFCVPAMFWLIYQFRDCLFSAELAQIISDGGAKWGVLVAWLGTAATWLKNTMGVIKDKLADLDKVKIDADRLVASKLAEKSGEELQLLMEFEKNKEAEERANQTLAEHVAKVEQLAKQLQELKESNSLDYFLKERTQSDDYRKHLGLISMVRRDFEKLEEKLANQETKNDMAQSGVNLKKIDRIILYIDDLDRCPANKVVDVLQAIHLLLAFKLFVVVVGVDSRWLLQSLERHYRELSTELNPQDAEHHDATATPQHYLEKIFQIHYALPRMTKQGYGKMIAGLIPIADEANQVRDNISATEQTNESKNTPTNTPNATPTPASAAITTGTATPAGTAEIAVAPRQTFEVDARVLAIREQERDFAASLHTLVPTPRAAKRLINSYRILKAGVGVDELAEFEGSKTAPGSFQLPLLLLAILISDAHTAERWFPELLKQDKLTSTTVTARQVLSTTGKIYASTIMGQIENLIADGHFPGQASLLKEWIPRVARFSFDVARAIE